MSLDVVAGSSGITITFSGLLDLRTTGAGDRLDDSSASKDPLPAQVSSDFGSSSTADDVQGVLDESLLGPAVSSLLAIALALVVAAEVKYLFKKPFTVFSSARSLNLVVETPRRLIGGYLGMGRG